MAPHDAAHRATPARPARTQGQRQLRVGEELRHLLAELLARGELRDPELQDRPVTVTEVSLSPDLKNATAYVVPLGGEHAVEIIAALRRSAPYLRRLLGRELHMRYTPQVRFELDTTFDNASKIAQLLHRPDVRRDLADEAAPEPDPAADGA
jgi:ribosome-binding factor A